MKKIKYLIPILIMFIVVNVKAIDACTPEEMNRLRELAKNVQFKTEYELFYSEEDDYEDETTENGHIASVYYMVKVINMNENLKILMKNNDNNKYEKVNLDDEMYLQGGDISSFSPGSNITLKIYSYTTNLCTNELLRTETIKFDSYNYWYSNNKEECKNYPDFKYCKEFMEVNKDDEEIDKLFNEYKKDTKGESNSKILDFISNNKYVIIIISAVIIIGVAVFIILKRNKKEKI